MDATTGYYLNKRKEKQTYLEFKWAPKIRNNGMIM
jgi:hypothetical protein